MTRRLGEGAAWSALLAALLMYMALAAPAAAMQVSGTRVLEAADHAELRADVAAAGVSRIALVNDRIARVVRSPGGFVAEHDPASGDLYLRALAGEGDVLDGEAAEPAVLFLGTEKGFTYRLVLHRVAGGPAQVLIRNPEAAAATHGAADAADPRIGALVRLVGAVARREPLAGYAIAPVGGSGGIAFGGADAVRIVETWRGPRFEALVLDLGPGASGDAAALGRRLGPGIAAVWLAARQADGARLAVAVREIAPVRGPGPAGGVR